MMAVFIQATLTMSETALVVAALINLIVCGVIAWASACRAAKTSRRSTRSSYRVLYAASGASAFMGSWSWPWVGPWWHVLLLGCYAWSLALSADEWRSGVPARARRVR